MSRGATIKDALQDQTITLKSIPPSGDCFYEAVAFAHETVFEDLRDVDKVTSEPGDDPAMALRRTAANSVDQEVFSNFAMYHEAGLPDFSFMRRCRDIEALRDRLLVPGKGAGAGHCLWANEFEIGVICKALNINCLILDLEAREKNNRFVKVGEEGEEDGKKTRYVLLQRSRREHYNLVIRQGIGLFSKDQLSENMKTSWQI